MSTSTTAPRTYQLPSAAVLIGSVYAVCVVALVAVFTGEILFTDKDPHASEGPIESIISVSIVGTAALVIGVGLARWFVGKPERARVGTFVLLGLSVLTIVFFWSGAPGILGACAAWCAGLTRGARPLQGAPRVAGMVGAFIALLNVVLTVGGMVGSALF